MIWIVFDKSNYLKVNEEYLVSKMKISDIDRILKLIAQDEDRAEDNRRHIAMELFDNIVSDQPIGPRRMWQIAKRLQRWGYFPGYDADTALHVYNKTREMSIFNNKEVE